MAYFPILNCVLLQCVKSELLSFKNQYGFNLLFLFVLFVCFSLFKLGFTSAFQVCFEN